MVVWLPRPVSDLVARILSEVVPRRGGQRARTLSVSGSIELGLYVSGGEVDVTGGRVDVGMTKQRLHDGEIDARFGERGAEGVPECVRMAAWDTSRRPVIAKDRAQARRGQWLTAVGSFGHDEQPGGLGLWTFGEQVGLNDAGYVHVEWNTAFFGPFAAHAQPPSADVDIANIESQHFAGPQAAKHHQPRHRPVPPGPQAPDQGHDVAGVQRTRQPLGLSNSQG